MRFLAGKGKAVAPDPIQLTVYSPVVPNLTLVDMPGGWHRLPLLALCAAQPGLTLLAGLTKVPIDGQPRSIVKDLEDMARTYIKVHHCNHGRQSYGAACRCGWASGLTALAAGRQCHHSGCHACQR